MSSIFLSYSSKDKEFVQRLAQVLSENGVKVWLYDNEIKVGDYFMEKMRKGIMDVKFLGIVLSPNSVKSKFVREELGMAEIRELVDQKIRILPILFKNCEIPISLRSKVYADFRYKKIFQHSLLKLLEVILPYGFRKSLFEIIKKAAHIEFSAYKKLPVINLSNLDKYFTQKGSARKRIVHLLRRHKQRGWILNNPLNPSTFEILNIKLKKIEDKISTVETEEYWYLRWFSKIDGKYKFIYDERNLQTYKMKKDKNGFWKVDINIYPNKEYIG